MLIDFHIHAFPDALTEKAVGSLAKKANELHKKNTPEIEPVTTGREDETREYLKKEGADIGVLMSIATRAGQQKKVNDWAKSVSHGNIAAFGSVFPFDDDALTEIDRIKSLGLYGIKLHPDHQGFFVEDERLLRIYEAIERAGLPLLFHSGFDPISPTLYHGTPKAIADVARRFDGLTVIAAHMGGAYMREESMEHLLSAGLKNLYVDTSMASHFMTNDELYGAIRTVGVERTLYATDMPWSDGVTESRIISSLGFSQEELDGIFYKNAEKLLGITLTEDR